LPSIVDGSESSAPTSPVCSQPSPSIVAAVAALLAVATVARIANLPTIPTLNEIGVKDFESYAWNAIAAPPKTPPAIVAKLNKAINEVLQESELKAHFSKINLLAVGGSPAEAAAFIKKETTVWGNVIKEAHVLTH